MRAVGSDSPRGPLPGPLFFSQIFDLLATFLNFLCLMGGRWVQLEGSLVVRLC